MFILSTNVSTLNTFICSEDTFARGRRLSPNEQIQSEIQSETERESATITAAIIAAAASIIAAIFTAVFGWLNQTKLATLQGMHQHRLALLQEQIDMRKRKEDARPIAD